MDPVGRSPLIAGEYDLHWHQLIFYRVLHNHCDRITLSITRTLANAQSQGRNNAGVSFAGLLASAISTYVCK